MTATSSNRPKISRQTAHERGREIYNFRCYYCHGYSGDAKTLAATFLDPKPRNFKTASLQKLTRSKMIEAVEFGRLDTGMKSFSSVLSPQDIEWVVDFIRHEFMYNKAENTRYHTKENGWANHDRYLPAYPFATGEIPIDTPWNKLSKAQQGGLTLFMKTCISCHDRAKVNNEGDIWAPRPVSYPRNGYDHKKPRPDAITRASIYGKHDIPPKISDTSPQVKQGEGIFQKNCAFCHGADGTGKNWIGSFLEPHPRNLTSKEEMYGMSRERLRLAITYGVSGTKMPAWGGVLNKEQINALIAYINVAFHPLDN